MVLVDEETSVGDCDTSVASTTTGGWVGSMDGVCVLVHPDSNAITIKVKLVRDMVAPIYMEK